MYQTINEARTKSYKRAGYVCNDSTECRWHKFNTEYCNELEEILIDDRDKIVYLKAQDSNTKYVGLSMKDLNAIYFDVICRGWANDA